MVIVQAVVEIPQGSQNKYEYDTTTKRIRLDRVLYGAMHYPVNYGFIPGTWGEDHDPLDILIMCSTSIHPGIHVAVRVLGSLEMYDEHGPDTKVVGVADCDARFDQVQRLDDLGPHRLREMTHFFSEYKQLQNLSVRMGDYHDEASAIQSIKAAQQRYQQRQADQPHV